LLPCGTIFIDTIDTHRKIPKPSLQLPIPTNHNQEKNRRPKTPQHPSTVKKKNITHITSKFLLAKKMVGGLDHFCLFFHMLGMSSSQLTQSDSYFSEGLAQPPTSNPRYGRVARRAGSCAGGFGLRVESQGEGEAADRAGARRQPGAMEL